MLTTVSVGRHHLDQSVAQVEGGAGRERQAGDEGSLIFIGRIERGDEVGTAIEDSGIDSLPYDKRWGRYRLRLTEPEVKKHRDLLIDLTRRASGMPPPADD
jgi:hypothetical protein